MKAKILTLLLAVMSGFALTIIQAHAENKPGCLIILANAPRFEDKQIGEGGFESKLYKAYEEAFKNSDSIKKEQYEWLLINGTPAGKIYGAMLLRGTQNADDRNSFARLTNDQSRIKFQSGCEVTEDTVSAIAKSFMKSGNYFGFKYLKKSKDK